MALLDPYACPSRDALLRLLDRHELCFDPIEFDAVSSVRIADASLDEVELECLLQSEALRAHQGHEHDGPCAFSPYCYETMRTRRSQVIERVLTRAPPHSEQPQLQLISGDDHVQTAAPWYTRYQRVMEDAHETFWRSLLTETSQEQWVNIWRDVHYTFRIRVLFYCFHHEHLICSVEQDDEA
jgi:hypothetical protein